MVLISPFVRQRPERLRQRPSPADVLGADSAGGNVIEGRGEPLVGPGPDRTGRGRRASPAPCARPVRVDSETMVSLTAPRSAPSARCGKAGAKQAPRSSRLPAVLEPRRRPGSTFGVVSRCRARSTAARDRSGRYAQSIERAPAVAQLAPQTISAGPAGGRAGSTNSMPSARVAGGGQAVPPNSAGRPRSQGIAVRTPQPSTEPSDALGAAGGSAGAAPTARARRLSLPDRRPWRWANEGRRRRAVVVGGRRLKRANPCAGVYGPGALDK